MKASFLKKSIRTAGLILALVVFCIGIAENVFAADNTTKYYKLTKCTLTYNSIIGQVRVNWNETERETAIVAFLYMDGILIAQESISGMSWDVTEYVHEVGTLTVEAYPDRLGRQYSLTSNSMLVTEDMLVRILKYDPWPYQPSYGEIRYDKENAKITGFWEFNEKSSTAVVKLYRGETAVDSWRSYSGNECDFSEVIAKKGTGTYKFKFYSARLGDSYTVFSYEFEVDSDILKEIKAKVTAEQKAEEIKRNGWYREGSTYIWRYYKAPGEMVRKEWLTDKGNRYHFSSGGIMQIGWQVIDDKYYYFDSTGALVTDTITPDGCRVNQNGEYVDANGSVVSANGEAEAPATPKTLDNCKVKVTETADGPGIIKQAAFKENTSGFVVEKATISIPYENWTPGVAVTVKLEVSTTTNVSFGSRVSFSIPNCKNITSSGNSKHRTVLFSYIPKKQLLAPDHFYMSTNHFLRWKQAEKASQYKLVFSTSTDSVTVDTNSCDLDAYVDLNSDEIITVKVYSLGAKTAASYYLTSPAVIIDDLKSYVETHTIEGELQWNNIGLRYYDDIGDKVTGWKQILGSWYYFKKTGYAAGPGWYQDSDKLWYYFDNEYRMCTGTINDGVADYFLNDGTVTNLPLGAWVKDRR